MYKIGRRTFSGCRSLASLILPVTVREIGFDAFAGCSSLSRIALPRGVREVEDDDIFSGCDALSEISYGGSKEDFELLFHGKSVTVKRSDLTLSTPKITFLDLKHEI